MRSKLTRSVTTLIAFLGWSVSGYAATSGPSPAGGDFSGSGKVPAGVILVKGAWSSASDTITPLPESGQAVHGVYSNPYFRISYPLPAGWSQKFEGPPPSDRGYYVLAQISPTDAAAAKIPGTLLIGAQDMFFAPIAAGSPLQLVRFKQNNLRADYQVEQPPAQLTIAGHSFVQLGYFSPSAQLHWHVLVTQLRCHLIEFVFTSRDPHQFESLLAQWRFKPYLANGKATEVETGVMFGLAPRATEF
jgi:hypothetical protein